MVHLWKWRGRIFGRHCTQLRTLIIKTHINVSLVLSKRLSHILFSLMNMKLMPVGATETENARAEVSWTHLRWQVLGQIVQVAQGLCQNSNSVRSWIQHFFSIFLYASGFHNIKYNCFRKPLRL